MPDTRKHAIRISVVTGADLIKSRPYPWHALTRKGSLSKLESWLLSDKKGSQKAFFHAAYCDKGAFSRLITRWQRFCSLRMTGLRDDKMSALCGSRMYWQRCWSSRLEPRCRNVALRRSLFIVLVGCLSTPWYLLTDHVHMTVQLTWREGCVNHKWQSEPPAQV